MSQELVKTEEIKSEDVKVDDVSSSSLIYKSPFNNVVRPVVKPSFPEFFVCLKPVAVLVDGEPGLTKADFSDKVSVQSIVDTNKDYCGLAYALRQINGGRLLPSQLHDDGRGSVDLSEVPDNVNDAYRLAEQNVKAAKAVQDDLGLGLIDSKHIEEYVTKAINARIAELQASKSKEDASK